MIRFSVSYISFPHECSVQCVKPCYIRTRSLYVSSMLEHLCSVASGRIITLSVGAVVACSFVELTISPCKFRPLHPVLSPSLYAVEGYIRPPTFASKSVMGRSCDRFRLAPREAAAAVANSRSFECDLRCRYIRIHDAVFNRMHMAVCGAYVIYADDVAPDDRRCWRGVA